MATNVQNPMQNAMSTTEAARRSGLSHATILRCFDRGLLQGYKLPGSRYRRILPKDLAQFMRTYGIPCEETKEPALNVKEVDMVLADDYGNA